MNNSVIFGSVAILLLGALSFGTITSFPSLAINSIKSEYPELGDPKFNNYITWFLNAPRLTAALGPFLIIFLLPIFGSKVTLSISSFLCGVCWFLLMLIDLDDKKNNVHFNIKYGLIVRIILGLFWGIISTLTITYMVDITPSDSVGLTGCLYQLFIILGICLNNILAAFYDWKSLIIIDGIINIAFSFCLIIIKDSPVSNMLKQHRNAEKVNIDRKNKKKKSSYYHKWEAKNSILSNTTNFKNIISSMAIFFFQQYSGINAILNNLGEIMKNSGLDLNPNIQSAMSTLAQFLACFLACFLMDHLGPKILWLASSIGCLCSLAIYSYCIYDDETKSNIPHYVPLAAAFTYCLFFGLGLGPSPWVIFPVQFPDLIRYECNCWMLFSHYIISFIVCYTHPIIENQIGEFYAILIYILCCFGGCFYGWFFIHFLEEEDQGVSAML